jgi:O-antigen ligase
LALATNAAAISLFSMVQLLTSNGKIYWVRASPWGSAGPFYNHNHLAAYLNLGLAAVVGLLLASERARSSAKSRGARLLTGYAAAVIVVGVVVSLSRSGFLAMSALAVVALLTLRPRGFRVGVGLAFVVVLVALLLPAFGGLVAYPARIESILRAESYQSRFQIWTAALQSWQRHPFWGSGLGAFGPAVARFRQHDDGVVFLHAENEYVEWLVEGGLVAVVLVGLLSFGVIRAGRRAERGSQSRGDRALVVGAAFAGLTLLVHSASDFAMHTAAVALPAVMLAAFVVKAGSEASPARTPRQGWGRVPSFLGVGLLSAVAGACVASLARLERSESMMALAGLGTYERYERLSGAKEKPGPLDSVRERDLIGDALLARPGWAEGYLWLGRVLLRQYEEAAAEAVRNAVTDPKVREKVTTPLWLHRQVHATPPGRREPAEKLAAEAPIGLYLVPALRAFLEARRCCPYIALPHAEIGGLDFLLARGDPAGIYLRRAERLAGARVPLLALTAEFAANTGDLDVAALCWRRMLAAPEADWEAIADRARADLPPDRVLAEVVPDAGFTIRFAERLYPSVGEQGVRELFAREALDRLDEEHQLPRPKRLEIEARARRLLGEVELACTRIAEALALEPGDGARRLMLIQWLLAAGKPAEAHRQAVIGVTLDPTDRGARDALKATLEASHPTHTRSGTLPP